MERPPVERFIELTSSPASDWGMADHDVVELCNWILDREAEISRLKLALEKAEEHADRMHELMIEASQK